MVCGLLLLHAGGPLGSSVLCVDLGMAQSHVWGLACLSWDVWGCSTWFHLTLSLKQANVGYSLGDG